MTDNRFPTVVSRGWQQWRRTTAAQAGATADYAEHQAAPAEMAEAAPMVHGAGCGVSRQMDHTAAK